MVNAIQKHARHDLGVTLSLPCNQQTGGFRGLKWWVNQQTGGFRVEIG